MPFLKRIIATIISIILKLRHALYDLGIFKSFSTQTKTIVVGNLAIGGSGKTPFTDFIIQQIKSEHHLVFLSRGYGRKTKGIFRISSNDTAEKIGDEPLLIHSHHAEIPAYVGEDRVKAIQQIEQENSDLDIIVLDDAFQHRRLRGNINVLLSRFDKPFFNDHIWPMGGLRDLKSRAQNADLIVFTGAPDKINFQEKQEMKELCRRYSKADVFFAHIEPREIQPVFNHNLQSYKNFGSLCGIAHPENFHENSKKNFSISTTLNFKDHHRFSENDLNLIRSKMVNFGGPVEAWITTEKDAMRIKHLKGWESLPVFFGPIVLKINEEELTEWNLWWKNRL